MKYDEELFEFSELFTHNTSNKKEKRDITTKKRKLFRIVLTDLRRHIDIRDGFYKVIFYDRFWGECDEGYTLVKELLESDSFKNFSKDYLIYITDSSNLYDESHPSFYELTWDYQTYFEFMKYHKILGELNNMPEKVRDEAVEEIKNTINNYKIKAEENKNLCSNIGHSIVSWRKMEQEDSKIPFWYGTCTRCGAISITRKNPYGPKLERTKK